MIRQAVEKLCIIGCVAIVAVFQPLAFAQSPTRQSAKLPRAAIQLVSQKELDALGFRRTTDIIKNDGYAQLLLVPYVIGEGQNISVRCLEGSMWGFSLSDIFKEDTKTELGVKIESPLVPSETLAPLTFKRTRGAARSCSITTNTISYRSPLYYVNDNNTKRYKISALASVSNRLNADTRNAINAIAGAISFASGVPAATAAPYLNAVGRRVETASVSNSAEHIFEINISAGTVREPSIVWGNNVVLVKEGRGSTAPETIQVVLIAQLVPVSSVITEEAAGDSKSTAPVQWAPSRILRSPFEVPIIGRTTGGTLGEYIDTIASSEIQAYITAQSPEAINLTCMALVSKLDANIGLSRRDLALAAWALAKRRVVNGRSNDAEIDNLRCLADYGPEFTSAGIRRLPPPPQPPSIERMQRSTEINDALRRFFTLRKWDEKRQFGRRLFSYPLTYSDSSLSMMPRADQVESVDSWVANAHGRDIPFLQKIDCYAYFDGKIQHPVVDFKDKSVMFAFGEVSVENAPPTEVALQMTFKPINDDESATISDVSVLNSIDSNLNDAVREVVTRDSGCTSGYRPNLLFGVESALPNATP